MHLIPMIKVDSLHTMTTYAKVTTDIQEATQVIKSGRVVAVPTGTSYGLAADALQGHALQRVRNMKHRSVEKALTVFMDPALYETYLALTPQEKNFITAHPNQAITLLVTPKPALEHLSQDGRIGLRLIDHPLMEKLAQAAQVPLTATSANLADQPACFDLTCITTAFPGKLTPELLQWYESDGARGTADTTYDLSLGSLIDGGTLPASEPSTILKIEHNQPVVIRPGKFRL